MPFNCIYEDGSVLVVDDLGMCPAPREDGVNLVDITELSTTVNVTTEAPVSDVVILGGLVAVIVLGSMLDKKGGR